MIVLPETRLFLTANDDKLLVRYSNKRILINDQDERVFKTIMSHHLGHSVLKHTKTGKFVGLDNEHNLVLVAENDHNILNTKLVNV